MAITLKDSGTTTGTGNGSGVHLNTLATGDAVFVMFALGAATTNRMTVTDSNSNTYTRLLSINGAATSTICLEVWACLATTNLSNTTSWTFTNAGTDVWAATYFIVGGLAATNSLDRTASNAANAATTGDSTTTAATRQANEIVLGFFAQQNNRPPTAGSGYSQVNQAANGTTATAFTEYKVVAATGTQQATCTWDLSSNYVGAVMTFADTAIASGLAPVRKGRPLTQAVHRAGSY